MCNRQRVCNTENLTTFSYPGLSPSLRAILSICLLLIIYHDTSLLPSLSLFTSILTFPLSILKSIRFDLILFFYYYYIWIRISYTETVLDNQSHNAHFQMIAFLVCELQESRIETFKSKYFWTEKKMKRKWNDKIYCLRLDSVYTLYSVQWNTQHAWNTILYLMWCDSTFCIFYIHNLTRVDQKKGASNLFCPANFRTLAAKKTCLTWREQWKILMSFIRHWLSVTL